MGSINQSIVTTEWLEQHLTDPAVRIVDIRGHVAPPTDPKPHYFNHLEAYQRSHIPGAVFVDWVREITDPADPQHAKIAPPERYAAAMRRAGISEDTLVVAYDDAGGMFSARLWWSLNYFGHAKVAVLDGGWTKWEAEGRPQTAEVPAVPAGNFTAHPQPAWLRTVDDVAAIVAGQRASTLIDARSPQEFRGEASRASRAGHIPGALNITRASLNAADGTLLPAEQLKEVFEAAGVNPDDDVTTYCNGGVSASYALLALRAAGYDNSAMYDGSWKEWGNQPNLPME